MLKYLKPYRKQIKAIIYILGFFAVVNWIIGLYLMITYKAPLQDFNIENKFSIYQNPSINQSFNSLSIFIVIFIIIVCLMLPFVLIEKEFKRQELLNALKNKK
jgi:hypothetical protein